MLQAQDWQHFATTFGFSTVAEALWAAKEVA